MKTGKAEFASGNEKRVSGLLKVLTENSKALETAFPNLHVTAEGHTDWSVVLADGPRFENLVASHLLKWVHYQQDVFGKDRDLRYFRDTDGREVDFVLVERKRPVLLVECKWADTEVDRGLRYLKTRFPDAQAWQLSAVGTKDYQTPEGIRVAPALSLLGSLV